MSRRVRARAWHGLVALLLPVAAVLAVAPAADAATTLPTPNPPQLTDAVVTGCKAPCATGKSGQVTLTWRNPSPPDGAIVLNYAYANGFNIGSPTTIARSGNTVRASYPICAGVNTPTPDCYQARVDALRGNELMTVTARFATGNPDEGTLQISAESARSNGLVPSQG